MIILLILLYLIGLGRCLEEWQHLGEYRDSSVIRIFLILSWVFSPLIIPIIIGRRLADF